MGLRIAIVTGVLALVPGVAAFAAGNPSHSWASPEIQTVAAADLMGTKDPATFRPTAKLTAQALEDLVFALKQRLFPPLPAAPPTPPPPSPPPTTTTDPTTTTTTDPTTTTVPVTTTDPTTTTVTTTTTTPAPVPVPPVPLTPPKAVHPQAAVSMAGLDARLVVALGLSKAASEFAAGARAAGLRVPGRFGTEVAARLLGLRIDHPAAQDSLELLPNDSATRAEAAYSAAQILNFSGWEIAAVQSLADSFALPHLTTWQTRILDTAVARIGMPYIWGGTSDSYEAPFGVPSRGGYDCSGFVWRVYKLQPYAGERDLASVLRGRTTFQMSGEVPRSELVNFKHLQPADVIFFGARGPRSDPSEVDHMGIYIGNGWFIHSSGYGVALATLNGWYRHEFAWARRPLREASLSG
ncbi:MAG TPA: C40 family peptidase [Gaiellaceae bacterium]|nr:C40 family peptidase [Gaiellaceae bacterium]